MNGLVNLIFTSVNFRKTQFESKSIRIFILKSVWR